MSMFLKQVLINSPQTHTNIFPRPGANLSLQANANHYLIMIVDVHFC